MSFPVSMFKLSAWNIQKSVLKNQMSSWNNGLPVQANMSQMAAVPWISSLPS